MSVHHETYAKASSNTTEKEPTVLEITANRLAACIRNLSENAERIDGSIGRIHETEAKVSPLKASGSPTPLPPTPPSALASISIMLDRLELVVAEYNGLALRLERIG